MKRGKFRIAGQAPKVKWKRNVGRRKRTIEEAVVIAKRHGVAIPDDVEFMEAQPGELKGSLKEMFADGEMETARGRDVYSQTDGYVYWRTHYNHRGKIMFQIHPDVLTGDECIVGVFQHEMFELVEFREVFMTSKRRRMNADDYGLQASPGYPGNFHDLAWDSADAAVLRMREVTKR